MLSYYIDFSNKFLIFYENRLLTHVSLCRYEHFPSLLYSSIITAFMIDSKNESVVIFKTHSLSNYCNGVVEGKI